MDRTPGIRPRPSLGRRLDAAARACFPGATTALLLVLLAAPLALPGQAELQPATVLACVFFWSLFRPASMPPALVFVLGLFSDLLEDAPVGVAVLTLLVVHGLALRWRRDLVRQGFLVVWLAFCAVAAGAAALVWALNSVLSVTLQPPGPAIFQAALGGGLYPALAALFVRAHRGLAAPEQA
jgi:rod shape-determining protein MreD